MPFKISFRMTWLSRLSYCIIFQITERNNELTLGLFKQTFFLKSDAANSFSHCITSKNHINQFSQKILIFRGAQLDFSL